MKIKMIALAIIFFMAGLACGIAYYFARYGVLLTLAITFGTCFYHFGLRLVVGHSIDAIFKNKMNYDRWWFRERKFETTLYKILLVKKWKRFMPTYKSEYFDIRKHSLEEIVMATCQAEIVHEVNMVLSFVPVVFTIWFGSLAAFLITSCVAFCFDGIFVIMQRYNRPRLRRLIELKNKRKANTQTDSGAD
ncbi:MAG: hypothetical protein J1G38_04390 [Clostridiales bacterium]|nr:hypothetical protein [Clostridiales bacterium]